MFHLCNETGAKALGDECPIHQTEDCIGLYVRADPEWQKLRRELSNAESVARVALHRLKAANRELTYAIKSITQPKENVFGVQPPLMEDD